MNRTKPTNKNGIGIESVKIIVRAIIRSLSWLARWLTGLVGLCMFQCKKNHSYETNQIGKQKTEKNNNYLVDKSLTHTNRIPNDFRC